MLGLLLGVALSLGREIPLSTRVIEPAPFTRNHPAVASNGDGFLVVWTTSPYGGALRGARVDRDGDVLDAESLVIGQQAAGEVAVASDGEDYVVAYNCARDVCLVHVDAETGNTTRGATFPGSSNAAIASNGNGYLVVAQQGDSLNTRPLAGFAVRADATLESGPFAIASSPFRPAVASNGRDYLVVWSTYDFLETVLVSDRAVLGQTQRFTSFDPAWGPGPFGWSVASNGEDFLVAWQQNLRVEGTNYVTDLRVSRVSADGTAGALRTVLDERAWEPALTWTGSRYLLTYTDGGEVASAPYLWWDSPGDVHGLTVDAAGGATEPVPFAARPGREAESASAFNGAQTLVVWAIQHRGDAAQIEGRFLGSDRTFVISTGLTWQESVAGLRRGGNAVFAWSEITGEEQVRKVFLQRVDAATRTRRDGRGIAVAESARHQQRPALGGSLVAWLENDVLRTHDGVARVRVRALDATGAPVGNVIEAGIAAPGSTVAIAAAGSTHLVVWETPEHRIAGAHIDPVMRPDEPPQSFLISNGPLDNTPSVASDGDDVLIVWQRDRYEDIVCIPGCTPPRSIHAARVTSWGVVGGSPVEVAERDSLTAPPRVVWNGAEYAVFWSRYSERSASVRHVNRNGLPVRGEELIAVSGVPLAVTWTGSEYQLALSERAPLISVRLGRDLAVIQETAVPSPVVLDSGVAVIDGWIAYSTGSSSRVVARPLAEDAPVTRRRSAR